MTEPQLAPEQTAPTTCLPRGSAVIERLMFRTALLANGCWEWRGAKNPKGYGNIRVDSYGPAKSTHRVAYTELVGPIPNGMEIDHLCRNRACINPQHLEAVDHATNVRRSERPAITHCKWGHEFNENNTRSSSVGRHCRPCVKEATRKYRQRKGEK